MGATHVVIDKICRQKHIDDGEAAGAPVPVQAPLDSDGLIEVLITGSIFGKQMPCKRGVILMSLQLQ